MNLQNHFEKFRQGIVGKDQTFQSPYGQKPIVYADWIASGRLYAPIEAKMTSRFGPWVGNTHSEASITGSMTTEAYLHAQRVIKKHVNAGSGDVLVAAGSGMTHVINKFQRMLGIRIPDPLKSRVQITERERPVVFLTHMEHHSNQTSWIETLAEVVILEPDPSGLVDPQALERAIRKYPDRSLKIGSFTSCSNVTGLRTPYHQLAKIMHRHGGFCFVDFACSAPYEKIDMHPSDSECSLDAIFFSPHKFLGGPGTPGILVFNSALYHSDVPDQPGGGTVAWTNPWGKHRFVEDIEVREDGGTPPFLQVIKTALAVRLKEEMDPEKMEKREAELLKVFFAKLDTCPEVKILANAHRDRLGAISFYVEDIHYNLIVKILNDRFGIQVRGGCSCAGTYGHYLLQVGPGQSGQITDKIDDGDLGSKPGWVRVSLHPTMTDDEAILIGEAIVSTVRNIREWEKDYSYSPVKNEYIHRSDVEAKLISQVHHWLEHSSS